MFYGVTRFLRDNQIKRGVSWTFLLLLLPACLYYVILCCTLFAPCCFYKGIYIAPGLSNCPLLEAQWLVITRQCRLVITIKFVPLLSTFSLCPPPLHDRILHINLIEPTLQSKAGPGSCEIIRGFCNVNYLH